MKLESFTNNARLFGKTLLWKEISRSFHTHMCNRVFAQVHTQQPTPVVCSSAIISFVLHNRQADKMDLVSVHCNALQEIFLNQGAQIKCPKLFKWTPLPLKQLSLLIRMLMQDVIKKGVKRIKSHDRSRIASDDNAKKFRSPRARSAVWRVVSWSQDSSSDPSVPSSFPRK